MEFLSTAERIGILGDAHGDLDHVLRVSSAMSARDIRTLLVLGDFGFIWPGSNWDNVVSKLSKRLLARNQSLFFVDGNHENFRRLYRFPIGPDGLRWIRPNIAHVPRGYRTRLASGRTMAALGGATSIDVEYRRDGISWWPQESITEAELDAVGEEPAELLVGHDAPLNLPALDRWLAHTADEWSSSGRDYAIAGRRMFHRGFLQVRPALYVGGHYHHHTDETIVYGTGDDRFESRVVIFDKNGDPTTISQGILNVTTFDLDLFCLANRT